jgi:hypothetical protein
MAETLMAAVTTLPQPGSADLPFAIPSKAQAGRYRAVQMINDRNDRKLLRQSDTLSFGSWISARRNWSSEAKPTDAANRPNRVRRIVRLKRWSRLGYLLAGLLCCVGMCAAPAMALVPLGGTGPSEGEYGGGGSGCSGQVVRDYGRVFSGLPSLSRPSRDGRLSFGPSSIRLVETPRRILVPGDAGSHAFGFLLTSNTTRRQILRLNWVLSSSLVTIDRIGRSTGIVSRATRTLRAVTKVELRRKVLRLRVPNRPGVYRAEIEFRSVVSGKRFGRIGQYIRVLKPRTAARLALVGNSTVEPGGAVVVRFENLGTRRVLLPEPYVLDQYIDGYWQRDVGVQIHDRPSIIRPIDAGLANDCVRVSVPADALSGVYRVRAPFFAGGTHRTWLEAIRKFQVQ